MAKFCVFCGNEPNEKTKEHVVPRWLIELTGDPKRKAFLGFIKDLDTGFRNREYSYDQFTFPACDICNRKYSSLEGHVKPVIEQILSGEEIQAGELSLLLDWLDKVRIESPRLS